MVLKECNYVLFHCVEGFKIVKRTDITQCKQCERVHVKKGDFCRQCENHNALYKVKTLDDQSEEIQKTI